VHLPRGNLEFSVEGRLPDKHAPIAVYCAGGVRSAFATKTLQDLGYTDVVSITGGFNKWKDEGLVWDVPPTMTQEQRIRYHRHILLPEVGEAGQMKLLNSKVLLLGAGGLVLPPRSISRSGGRDDWHHRHGRRRLVEPAASDTAQHGPRGHAKVDSAKMTLTGINPDVKVITYDTRLGATTYLTSSMVTTSSSTARQLPHALSRERRGAAETRPGGARLDLPLRGQITVFNPYVGPCYRCMIPSRHLPNSRPVAPRRACWACCPVSSVRSRPSRRSSFCSNWATRSSGVAHYDATRSEFSHVQGGGAIQPSACGEQPRPS